MTIRHYADTVERRTRHQWDASLYGTSYKNYTSLCGSSMTESKLRRRYTERVTMTIRHYAEYE